MKALRRQPCVHDLGPAGFESEYEAAAGEKRPHHYVLEDFGDEQEPDLSLVLETCLDTCLAHSQAQVQANSRPRTRSQSPSFDSAHWSPSGPRTPPMSPVWHRDGQRMGLSWGTPDSTSSTATSGSAGRHFSGHVTNGVTAGGLLIGHPTKLQPRSRGGPGAQWTITDAPLAGKTQRRSPSPSPAAPLDISTASHDSWDNLADVHGVLDLLDTQSECTFGPPRSTRSATDTSSLYPPSTCTTASMQFSTDSEGEPFEDDNISKEDEEEDEVAELVRQTVVLSLSLEKEAIAELQRAQSRAETFGDGEWQGRGSPAPPLPSRFSSPERTPVCTPTSSRVRTPVRTPTPRAPTRLSTRVASTPGTSSRTSRSRSRLGPKSRGALLAANNFYLPPAYPEELAKVTAASTLRPKPPPLEVLATVKVPRPPRKSRGPPGGLMFCSPAKTTVPFEEKPRESNTPINHATDTVRKLFTRQSRSPATRIASPQDTQDQEWRAGVLSQALAQSLYPAVEGGLPKVRPPLPIFHESKLKNTRARSSDGESGSVMVEFPCPSPRTQTWVPRVYGNGEGFGWPRWGEDAGEHRWLVDPPPSASSDYCTQTNSQSENELVDCPTPKAGDGQPPDHTSVSSSSIDATGSSKEIRGDIRRLVEPIDGSTWQFEPPLSGCSTPKPSQPGGLKSEDPYFDPTSPPNHFRLESIRDSKRDCLFITPSSPHTASTTFSDMLPPESRSTRRPFPTLMSPSPMTSMSFPSGYDPLMTENMLPRRVSGMRYALEQLPSPDALPEALSPTYPYPGQPDHRHLSVFGGYSVGAASTAPLCPRELLHEVGMDELCGIPGIVCLGDLETVLNWRAGVQVACRPESPQE